MSRIARKPIADAGKTPSEAHKPMAVIELGTTSVRMLIAQKEPSGELRVLDTLQQPVTLGRDTFTRGDIGLETTERCVQALKKFRLSLREYEVDLNTHVRAVATSAVREASNRQAFLDRLFVATGIDIEDLAPSEVSRFTYIAVQPLLRSEPVLRKVETLIAEVGGGSTEILHTRDGRAVQAHVFRLGSLRLREMMEGQATPPARMREVLVSQVDQAVRQIVQVLPSNMPSGMLALGGDARWAMSAVPAETVGPHLTRISVRDLSDLAGEVLGLSVNEVVRRYHLSYPDAETLGPALLVYVRLAKALRLNHFLVGNATLRDGVLHEMAGVRLWTAEHTQEIVDAAIEIGRKFGFDQPHAANVTALARHLFHALREEHGLHARSELVLAVASTLHDIGLFISPSSHHKHSLYLILNSDIFGLRTGDQMLAALVARYHRRAFPDPDHEFYATLNRADRVTVLKLAAILRVADALDCRHGARLPMPEVAVEPGRLIITLRTRRDLTLERHALHAKGEIFKHVYGMDVILQNLSRQPLHE